MEMKPIEKSSNVKAIGYDPESKKMRVAFKGRDGDNVYEYTDVAPHVHAEMLAAESAGSYFAKNIRGKYGVEKLTGQWSG